ncbi:hypothetical protein F7725_028616 [Dissostichus mawsoni]|uniref:Uncharacterized protein n=1 Tax=Dissostichus mawsoni TaxID=36200 RepID=A0A7J5XIN7_DISMA|nr:hypothetical protein F7725_028616 [Dissostichus mawsoni]
MYHPLTPGQSWVQSPVSFRRGGGEMKRWPTGRGGSSEDWTSVALALFSQHIRVSGEPVSAAFALYRLKVSGPRLSLRQDG